MSYLWDFGNILTTLMFIVCNGNQVLLTISLNLRLWLNENIILDLKYLITEFKIVILMLQINYNLGLYNNSAFTLAHMYITDSLARAHSELHTLLTSLLHDLLCFPYLKFFFFLFPLYLYHLLTMTLSFYTTWNDFPNAWEIGSRLQWSLSS